MTSQEEAEVRRDERLKTLRQIRDAAIRMGRDPSNDSYLWGYGAREICGMITAQYERLRDG